MGKAVVIIEMSLAAPNLAILSHILIPIHVHHQYVKTLKLPAALREAEEKKEPLVSFLFYI